MKRKPTVTLRAAAALWLGACLAAPGLATEAIVWGGSDRALILPPRGAEVEDYANAGYRLRHVEGAVEVEVDLAPIGSAAAFLPARSAAASPQARLALAVTAGSRTQHEAVTRLLNWIAGNVRYELDRGAAQDPEAVLARRSAYCTGFARLAVALLEPLGIEAREVAGYVVEELPGARGSGFHRWIEVRYPDRGWVFSDPLASQGFVPASYLRLASGRLAIEGPGPALLLGRDDRTQPIDIAPGAPAAALRVRANRGERRAAALRVALASGRDGEAVLEGGGQVRTLLLPHGRGTFLGLEPGRYRLQVSDRDGARAWKEVTFRDRVLAEVRISEAQGTTAGGAKR